MLFKSVNSLLKSVILLAYLSAPYASTIPPGKVQLPLSTPPGLPSNIYALLPEIFDTSPSASNYDFDEFDDYVPYRSDSHDVFSWQLLTQVLQEEQTNIMISPFSVKLVLAELSEAAGNRSQTQKELYSTLTDIRMPDNLRGFYKKILTSLKKPNPHYTLNLETKLYTDAFIEPQQRYAAMLQSFYDTEIERLDFGNAVAAANAINSWSSNVTNGRLQNLVNENNIRGNIMLMANVIYFNGLWRRPFNNSFKGVFFQTPNRQLPVEFMEQTEYFYYLDSPVHDAKIIRLPYKGKKFSMFIVLPKGEASVDQLIRDLGNDQYKRMQFVMEEVKVKVTVPKFRFTYSKDLKAPLQYLGINDIFTDDASFPGLARGADVAGRLKVSNIFQKSGIDVNEKGTEAFAATVVEIDNKFGGSTSIEEFNVNRSFLFFIEEEVTGNIIFAGKVLQPFV